MFTEKQKSLLKTASTPITIKINDIQFYVLAESSLLWLLWNFIFQRHVKKDFLQKSKQNLFRSSFWQAAVADWV